MPKIMLNEVLISSKGKEMRRVKPGVVKPEGFDARLWEPETIPMTVRSCFQQLADKFEHKDLGAHRVALKAECSMEEEDEDNAKYVTLDDDWYAKLIEYGKLFWPQVYGKNSAVLYDRIEQLADHGKSKTKVPEFKLKD